MAVARTVKATQGWQQGFSTLTRCWSLLHGCHNFSSETKDTKFDQFDTRMLQVLACPLSKKPLRYDATNNELICDELGVAYPIVGGIPNLNPQDGRMIEKTKPATDNRSSENS